MRKEYIEERNLIAWSFVDYKNPTRQADILITKDLREMEVQKMNVGGRRITVVSLQGLLRMKVEAGRPQDLVDIKNIREKLNEKNKSPKSKSISPEEALQFLEDIRTMTTEIDEPTIAISLRVPGNILRSIKLKAKADGKKYQALMIEYLRKGLRENK